MRTPIVAGNWKMNLDTTTASQLVSEVVQMVKAEYSGNAHIIFSPPYPFLGQVQHLVKDEAIFHVSGQNMHQAEAGAFTGHVSADMLKSLGIEYVILGHSECRNYNRESNALLAEKIDRALATGLRPIYCIGETLAQREANETLAVNHTQMKEGTFHLSKEQFGQLVIAYEPVWAIGTGVTASPGQAQEVHQYIRQLIADQYDTETAENTSILYGGSVKPGNAPDLFAQADIDGGLVGGASLKSRDFTEIIKAI